VIGAKDHLLGQLTREGLWTRGEPVAGGDYRRSCTFDIRTQWGSNLTHTAGVHISHAAAQGQRGCREGLGLLAHKAARFAGRLDGGLLDRGHGGVEFVEGGRSHAHEPGRTEYPVAGGEVCLLVQQVVVLGGGAGIRYLADARALVGVADQLRLFLAEVARRLVRADGM